MKTKHFAFCILHFALLLTAIPSKAQLPTAERNSATLVYRITRDDLRTLYIKEKPVTEKMLHTFVTSYRGDEMPRLERGNYLLARAVNGQMNYKEYAEDNFEEAMFLNDVKPQIVLLNTLGGFIADAHIEGWKYNARTNSYIASKIKNGKVYEIDNNGVYHYIVGLKGRIARYGEPSWFARQWEAIKSWFRPKEDKYEGFIAFSKPVYKPNEKVRLKAYLTKNDKLYDKNVDVVLSGRIGGDTVLINNLAPYRKGMYETEFVLSESLELRLDDYYTVYLRDVDNYGYDDEDEYDYYYDNDRYDYKHLIADYFRYEEYELKSLRFTAKMSKTEYLASDSVEIKVKAVDENGLGIYDGRVEISVTSNRWNGSPLKEQVFVPDKIYSDKIDMEGFAEKTLTIPNSSFPQGFSGSYSVNCVFLTADNERRETHSSFWRAGDDAPVKKSETAPKATFVREDGQIKLSFENPDSLPIWYSVYEGKKLLEQGYGTAIERNYTEKKRAYLLQYWYYLADNSNIKMNSKTLPYVSENITMSITAPKTIYPGQKVEIGVDVTDRKGRAVENADITAYSYTSKFDNNSRYIKPVILRFNGIEDYTKPENSYGIINGRSYSTISKLDWNVWRERLGLDSLEFYKFLSPAPLYKYTENINTNRTVVLPFVVVDGEAVGVQVLYIDQQPVYMKAAQQRDVYAFDIASGHHTLRFRLPDREVTYLGNFERGKRIILSIDGSTSNTAHNIAVKNLPRKQHGKLSETEQAILDKYMIRLSTQEPNRSFYNLDVNEPLYINNNGTLYDLTNRPSRGLLVGPFPYNGQEALMLMRDGSRINWFNVYGATFMYNVDVHQLLIMQNNKSTIPQTFFSYRPEFNLLENPITRQQLDNEFITRIKDRFANSTGVANKSTEQIIINGYAYNNLILTVGKESGAEDNLCPMLIEIAYNNNKLLFYGSTKYFMLPRGLATLRLIMRDGRHYVLKINIKSDGTNHVLIDDVKLLDANSISKAIVDKAFKDYSDEPIVLNRVDIPYKIPVSEPVNFTNGVLVSGLVVDEDGDPIIGANVIVENTTVGTSTGIDGSYSLIAPADGRLTFSYLGKVSNTISIRNRTYINITMKDDNQVIQDVIVVAYSEATRTFAGAIDTRVRGVMTIEREANEEILFSEYSEDVIIDYGLNRDIDISEGHDAAISIRHNFSDDAFWQPRLTTDKKGHASFTTTFPDDITQWTAEFLAVGTPKQTAKETLYINSYLPLSARLSIPNFAVRGDRFNAIGRLTSYSDDSVKVVTPYGEVTFAKSYTTDIEATAGDTDSLTLEYSLMREDGFSDGERRTLPIYPVGTMEGKGEFVILENGETHTFAAESKAVSVTIHAEATELGSLLEEIERTVSYLYSCNEQMASKVKVLVDKHQICEALGREFDEKSDKELRKLISQILKNRNDEGFWGWWGVSNTEWWISAHIVEALVKAQKAGYEIDWNTEEMSMALMIALRGGDAKLSDRVLVMLHNLGMKADYETLFKELPKLSVESTIRTRLARLETKAALGLATTKDAQEIIAMSTETMFGGLSWSEKPTTTQKRYFIPSPDYTTTENTLSAYRTLQQIEDTDSLRTKIRIYLFEQRRMEGWGNTYSASRTIETMLPDLVAKAEGKPLADPALRVNGTHITEFPYTATFEQTDKIDVAGEGSVPIYVTAYQQVWNSTPEAVSTDFSVSSKFMQDGKEVATLTAGEPVELVVSVTPNANASYVMIDVPIPAGCSYEEHYQNRWGEIHREYFKERVSIFVRQMNIEQGVYTYTIKLIPRYTGSYTLNPARVELMYFPTFFGRNGIGQLEIIDSK